MGIVPAEPERAGATDAEYQAAHVDNIAHGASVRRSRSAIQQRIRERGYRPSRGIKFTLILDAHEEPDPPEPMGQRFALEWRSIKAVCRQTT